MNPTAMRPQLQLQLQLRQRLRLAVLLLLATAGSFLLLSLGREAVAGVADADDVKEFYAAVARGEVEHLNQQRNVRRLR